MYRDVCHSFTAVFRITFFNFEILIFPLKVRLHWNFGGEALPTHKAMATKGGDKANARINTKNYSSVWKKAAYPCLCACISSIDSSPPIPRIISIIKVSSLSQLKNWVWNSISFVPLGFDQFAYFFWISLGRELCKRIFYERASIELNRYLFM